MLSYFYVYKFSNKYFDAMCIFIHSILFITTSNCLSDLINGKCNKWTNTKIQKALLRDILRDIQWEKNKNKNYSSERTPDLISVKQMFQQRKLDKRKLQNKISKCLILDLNTLSFSNSLEMSQLKASISEILPYNQNNNTYYTLYSFHRNGKTFV